MVKVVSFDVVGTLIDYGYENYVWKKAIPQLYAIKKGIGWMKAKNYVLGEYDRLGNKDIRWFLPEYWFKRFNLDEDPMGVFKSHSDKVKFYPEVPSVIESISQKYDLVIASGTTKKIVEVMIEKLRHHFKHIFSPVTDCQEVMKTSRFYEMMYRILKVPSYELVHIGDEWHADFISPRSVGIKAIYLDRTGEKTNRRTVKDLEELEDLLQFL